MSSLIIFGVVACLLGLCLCRWPRRMRLRYRVPVLIAAVTTGAASIQLSAWLEPYRSLAQFETLATVTLTRQAPQQWLLILEQPGADVEQYPISGDQWRLDARIIRLNAWFQALGISPVYQFDRLGGRYRNTGDELSQPRTVYDLADDRPWSLWTLASQYRLPFIDGVYGSGLFMPASDGAIYEVKLGSSGLAATAVNDPAREALGAWLREK